MQTLCRSHLRCPLDSKTEHSLHGVVPILLQGFRTWDSCHVMRARPPTAALKVQSNTCFLLETTEHPDILLVSILSLEMTKVTDNLVFKHSKLATRTLFCMNPGLRRNHKSSPLLHYHLLTQTEGFPQLAHTCSGNLSKALQCFKTPISNYGFFSTNWSSNNYFQQVLYWVSTI